MTHQAASSGRRKYTYDVFLSFRGEDTRCNFTDHLYSALSDKGINTFIDDKLPRGEKISSELVKAIEESRISIVVFSQNYASSRWCLDELDKILQCKKSKKQDVRPIFYKVDPSDVRNQSGSFGEAFAQIEYKFKGNTKKLDNWRTALREAANLAGWPFLDGHEAQFLRMIVQDVSVQLYNHSHKLDVAMNPVGIESCLQDIDQLLNVGGSNVCMIGIWGAGGIGKTTLAKAVYNSIHHNFDVSCFLENVGEASMSGHRGLVELQETLLFHVVGDHQDLKVRNVDRGVNVIKKRLSHKRVLLVLDDVNQLEQLNYLARECDWFGFGSRIIITTRDWHLLAAHGVHLVYKVEMLGYDKALELFCLNAFRRTRPPNDYVELAARAVHYAQGLPLALITLGRDLVGRNADQWLAALDAIKRFPNKRIQGILRTSFDALDSHVKEIFLDIACFFNRKHVNYVTRILEGCELSPAIGLEVLKEKALITIGEGRIFMHDLIEEMGKAIVCQESPEPGKRSRLWSHEDVCHVLTKNTGTDKTIGIMIKLLEPDQMCLNAQSLSKMRNLKFFINCNGHFSGDMDYISNELRLLDWPRCQLQSFPTNFHPRKLVVLNMPHSCITGGEEIFKDLKILTSLNLEGSEFIKKIPDLALCPNLETLNLRGCRSLVEVNLSVGSLGRFGEINLKGSSDLAEVPDLDMVSLTSLNLSGTAIKKLPSSIGRLTSLKILNLNDCEGLEALPSSIWKLQELKMLDLSNCKRLRSIPCLNLPKHGFVVPTARDTNVVDDNCGLLALPKLHELRIGGCDLPDSNFLASLDCWKTLSILDLSGSNFVSLPTCISKYVNLQQLDLHCCKRLQEVLELPPKVNWVNVSDCGSLGRFSKFSKVWEHKESQGICWINMWNCHRLCHNVGFDVANMESILLNQVLSRPSPRTREWPLGCKTQPYRPDGAKQVCLKNTQFGVVVPGREVPNWFSCCKAVGVQFETSMYQYQSYTCELYLEIPRAFEWENIGVAVCAVFEEVTQITSDGWGFAFGVKILVDEVDIGGDYELCMSSKESTKSPHVWLQYIPLPAEKRHWVDEVGCSLHPYTCRVRFYFQDYKQSASFKLKSCGVHLVCQPDRVSTVNNSDDFTDLQEQKHEEGLLLPPESRNRGKPNCIEILDEQTYISQFRQSHDLVASTLIMCILLLVFLFCFVFIFVYVYVS